MSLATGYEAKIIKGWSVNEILMEIKKASLTAPYHKVRDNLHYITESHEVTPFPYPIFDKETDTVYVDSRPFTTLDRTGVIKVRNSLDDKFSIVAGMLENSWIRNTDPQSAMRAFSFANEVFVRWITNTVAHRYGLTPYQKNKFMALTAMYSVGMYYNVMDDAMSVARQLQMISRNYPIHIDVVQEVSATVDDFFPRDLDEFIEAINKVDFGARLRGLTSKEFLSLLNGAFWGISNAHMLVAIAVEYPPCMAAIVYMAVSNTMFKRSAIGTVVYDMNKGNDFKTYTRSLMLFLDDVNGDVEL